MNFFRKTIFFVIIVFGIAILIASTGFWYPSFIQVEKIYTETDSKLNSFGLTDNEVSALSLNDLEKAVLKNQSISELKGPHNASRFNWNKNIRSKTQLSFVYIHGFSASPDEINPTIENLSARLSSNSYFPRLTGHGFINIDKMADAKAEDWIHDTILAYKIGQLIGNETIMVGTSTGASLLLILTARKIIQPKALILISPNFRPAPMTSWMLNGPFGNFLAYFIIGKYRYWTALNPEMETAWSTTYPTKILNQLMRLMKKLDETKLNNIKTPMFITYTEKDDVIATDLIKKRFNEVDSDLKTIFISNSPNHVLCGKYTNPELVDDHVQEMFRFVKGLK